MGKYDLHKMLVLKNKKLIHKYIDRYNKDGFTVLCHIFDKALPLPAGSKATAYFKMIGKYEMLKNWLNIKTENLIRNTITANKSSRAKKPDL